MTTASVPDKPSRRALIIAGDLCMAVDSALTLPPRQLKQLARLLKRAERQRLKRLLEAVN